MAIATPFLPRIYYLNPQLINALELEQHIDRCAKMGFDHLLVPADRSEAPDPHEEDSMQPFSAVTKHCARKRLKCLVDLNIGSVAADSALPRTHPVWFSSQDQASDLPDPRYPIRHDAKWAYRFSCSIFFHHLIFHATHYSH